MRKRKESLFFSRVFLNREGVLNEFPVESLRSCTNFHIIKLKGIETLSQANELMHQECWIPEEDLSPLERGHFYLFQIIDCSVVSLSGTMIGRVKDFLFVNQNDLLVVDRDGSEILIPFAQGICVGIDLRKKEIIIDPPEGLLEINEI